MAAGRLSYTFGLKGPSLPVDTVCSSSLVRRARGAGQGQAGDCRGSRLLPCSLPALPCRLFLPSVPCSAHIAFSSVALGQCPAAINAGVNLLLTPNTTGMTQKAGMLAPDGRCKTLSPAADGYARADACGAMLLLPQAAAGPQGALALLAGTAVNQDGRSSSLTAPNGPAQQEVMRAALSCAGLAAADVAAVQIHGTGTALGDPIEVGALAAALLERRPPGAAPLALMAAKSWSGHAEPGAGGLDGLLWGI